MNRGPSPNDDRGRTRPDWRRNEQDSADDRGSSSERSPAAPSDAPAPSAAPAPPPSRTSAGDRIGDYVANLLKQYDKNYDGALDGEEVKQMKAAPKNADADSDGRLSRDELFQYYGGGYKAPAGSGQPQKSANEAPGGGPPDSDARESSQRSSRRFRRDEPDNAPPPSRSLDGSRPILMHEFAEKWTEERLEEYYRLDLNRDGVITPEEFRRAGG